MSEAGAADHAACIAVGDSRRLTGPSLLLDGPGAILDVTLPGVEAAAFATAWHAALERMLGALAWQPQLLAWRAWPGGASLAFTAPFDALFAATEVNEWAFAFAHRALDPGAPEAPEFGAEAQRLAALIANESRPVWRAIDRTARRRRATFLWDNQRCSVGLGSGSLTWPVDALPTSPAQVPWAAVHDIPCVLVTGTNGKSTTVRLLGAIGNAAGRASGTTSTDRVEIGGEVIAVGDYSGPNGARTLLRDRRVELGILEVARGGILRRGLPIRRARAAIVTNVANDHLGEYGIFDVDALAETKLVVAKAIGPEGRLVLNADDARLLERGPGLTVPVLWFTLDPAHPQVIAHLAAGGEAAVFDDGVLTLCAGGTRHAVVRADEVPITFGGVARYNIANALAAIGAAHALGIGIEAMRAGLVGFASSPESNPGRANRWQFGTLTAIVDFAHNPHGVEALAQMAAASPARRRALVIGQAGDRDDDSIREFARAAWGMNPDRVFVKDMERYLRGRAPGEVPAMLEAEFRAAGASADALEHCPSEMAAVRAALAWAREGDLLLLTTHEDRDGVIALMRVLEASGWRAGAPLPAEAPTGESPTD